MSIERIDTLLAVLLRAQILSAEQVDEVARELGPLYDSAQSLGEYLVEIDWLTAYQLQLLLAGQWDELLVGPYQVLDRLGEGGISEVFKAWDTVRGRVVALKVLRQHLAGNSDVMRQFQCELQAITRLSHPNIIKTFDANVDGTRHYFAMEFVEGMDLDRFVQQVDRLSIEQACDYIRQVAQGLQHAHQMGLVHRDIKPANLFLLHPPLAGGPPGAANARRLDPVVKIIDWGLARCVRENAGPPGHSFAGINGSEEKGSLIGTADFIAPEQARDPTLVDIRADIYSLGCTLFYLLAGRPPFQGSSLMQKLLQHQEATPPSLARIRSDVSPELDALIYKMMAKNPNDRFAIPLLVVTPLRRFVTAPVGSMIRPTDSSNGTGFYPGSSANLNTPSSANLPRPNAPGTALNLPRPGTQTNLQRPGTHIELPPPGSPGSSANLRRPGTM